MATIKETKSRIEFKRETNLYVVEPIVKATSSWRKLSDTEEAKKAIPLHFQEIKGKELYAKFVREENKSYWKLFIVDNSSVSILYVETGALNPVGKYQP